MTSPDFEGAHRHCIRHRSEVLASSRCGCFYCLATFAPGDISRWLNEGGEQTALCPECGIDSVLGSGSGYPATPEFLRAMHERWFG